jgi:hypothetical protein
MFSDDVRKSKGRERNSKGSIQRFSLSLLHSCIKFYYFSIVKRSEHSKFYWGYKGDYCIFNIFSETESSGRFYLCTKNKKLCETRWIERVEALADFSSSFEAIIDVLDKISECFEQSKDIN